MDYLTDLTFPSQNSDRFFQKYLSIGGFELSVSTVTPIQTFAGTCRVEKYSAIRAARFVKI